MPLTTLLAGCSISCNILKKNSVGCFDCTPCHFSLRNGQHTSSPQPADLLKSSVCVLCCVFLRGSLSSATRGRSGHRSDPLAGQRCGLMGGGGQGPKALRPGSGSDYSGGACGGGMTPTGVKEEGSECMGT